MSVEREIPSPLGDQGAPPLTIGERISAAAHDAETLRESYAGLKEDMRFLDVQIKTIDPGQPLDSARFLDLARTIAPKMIPILSGTGIGTALTALAADDGAYSGILRTVAQLFQ